MAAHLRTILLELRGTKPTEAILKALRVLKAFTIQTADGTSYSIDVEPLIGQGDSGILAEDVAQGRRRGRRSGGSFSPSTKFST